jgi:hypothetical protein
MLAESDIEQIEQDLRKGAPRGVMADWVEKLLRDREERILHDREVAVQLLADAPTHLPTSHAEGHVVHSRHASHPRVSGPRAERGSA